MWFVDRRDAGKRLGERLKGAGVERAVVIGLPRGGLVVAHEVARALNAPLDLLAVRKLGAPGQPELAIGAVAEGGVRWINETIVAALGVTPATLEAEIASEVAEVESRIQRFRERLPQTDVSYRTVVLVDDGLATGATALAAARALQARGAQRIVLAVPVSSRQAAVALRTEVDDIVCLETPVDLTAISAWYEDFSQVSDAEVEAVLEASRRMDVEEAVTIAGDDFALSGTLHIPSDPVGVVVFAHGSGSSRLSPRNVAVATALNDAGIATLLFDLLTEREASDRANVFDIPTLAARLELAWEGIRVRPELNDLLPGFFGASTGAAAALWAAADLGDEVVAVVSRGGRPDLAGPRLDEVAAPTLLIVGGDDSVVLDLNREARGRMTSLTELEVVAGASHLFEEPGAMESVVDLARRWFVRHFAQARDRAVLTQRPAAPE